MNIFKRLFSVLKGKRAIKNLFLIVKARESSEGQTEFNKYTGVGMFNVISVNPTKEELSDIYGRTIENDQIYVYDPVNPGDPKMVRISFIIKTTDDSINTEKEYIGPMSFILRDKFFTSNKSGVEKVKVIDNYGQTAWVTEEELKNQSRPINSNGGLAKILPPFRPAYAGEEELINFLSIYFNVERPMNYVNGEWIPSEKIEDAQISIQDIKKYFNGDVSELKEAIKLVPENKFKALLYVRNNDDNKTFQQVLSSLVLRPGSSNYQAFETHIKERKEQGSFSDCVFTFNPLQKYTISPTSFSNNKDEEEVSGWFKS